MTKGWRMVPNNAMRKRGREGVYVRMRQPPWQALQSEWTWQLCCTLTNVGKELQSRAEYNRTWPPNGEIRRNPYVGVVAENSAAALSQRMFTRSSFEELPGCIIRPVCSHSSLQWQWLQGGWSTHSHPIRKKYTLAGMIPWRMATRLGWKHLWKRQSWTCTRYRAWVYH